MVAFGVAYGTASLGCTLPIFLSVIGASLASRGSAAALLVIGFYALGMLMVVMALSLAAAFAREGLTARLKSSVPRMHRIGGILLTVAGIYLTYYWARVLWGPAVTLAQDPIGWARPTHGSGSRTVRRGPWRVGRRIRDRPCRAAVLTTALRRKSSRQRAIGSAGKASSQTAIT
jgi:cytochrome c-type biogenesis protein